MAKTIKFGAPFVDAGPDIELSFKDITSVVIGDKKYHQLDFFMKGSFYKLIRKNKDKIVELDSNDVIIYNKYLYNRTSPKSIFNAGQTYHFPLRIKLFLRNGMIHSFKGAAMILGDYTKKYFINDFEVTYKNWLEHPEVQHAIREEKLKRILYD